MIIVRNVSDILTFTQTIDVSCNSTLFPVYGTVEKANNYFGTRLHCQKWKTFDNSLKFIGLVEATRIIEQFNFIGFKADDDQSLQFPRGTDTLVPVAIEQACYEIAYDLLKGIDPQTERDNLFTKVQGYGPLRTEYRSDTVKPWIAAGITSVKAWEYLYPYLQARTELDLLRSN